jgi:midasin
LNECGSVKGGSRVVRPHPNFRLILVLDPRHGEVSRAMRNRGVELFILPHTEVITTAKATVEHNTAMALPWMPLEASHPSALWALFQAGVPRLSLAQAMAATHGQCATAAAAIFSRVPTLRELRLATSIALSLMQRGYASAPAIMVRPASPLPPSPRC